MQQHAAKIAALCVASLIVGLVLAETTPNELRPARSSALAALGQPQIAHYPGEGRVITGPDSFPVEYSPQYRAVLEAQDRERAAHLALPPMPGAAYDYAAAYAQPAPAEQLSFEPAGSAAAVTVHRAATSQEPPATEQPAPADQTEG